MDTTQIRQLVAAKIAGQGTNVDAGSALPDIINGLCDVIDNLPAPLPVVEITEDITNKVAITDNRFVELLSAGVVLFAGQLFVVSTGKPGFPLPDYSIEHFIFVNTVGLDYELGLAEFRVIVVWNDEQGCYMQLFEA